MCACACVVEWTNRKKKKDQVGDKGWRENHCHIISSVYLSMRVHVYYIRMGHLASRCNERAKMPEQKKIVYQQNDSKLDGRTMSASSSDIHIYIHVCILAKRKNFHRFRSNAYKLLFIVHQKKRKIEIDPYIVWRRTSHISCMSLLSVWAWAWAYLFIYTMHS